ncbi:MAG: type II toxin-antitoxin system HigB family toxin [Verrucomicrobiales bacterium]|jgi:mRNA interferase HigB|nr:type II toxin-antitoxin system HigB family toxin [Verrucomicrobiales bacterium]
MIALPRAFAMLVPCCATLMVSWRRPPNPFQNAMNWPPVTLGICRADSELVVINFMHVITRKRLNEFAERHPDARSSLAQWYALVKKRDFRSFAELRIFFPHADQMDNKTVFNISGNKYRLIAAIHYNRRRIYIRAILTHAEYDRNTWNR